MESKNDLHGVVKHLAIIMDGNGRWAKERGLKRTDGHREGAHVVKSLLNLIDPYGIKYLTLYAFSSENWKRPQTEVLALMNLLKEFIEVNLDTLMENNIKLSVIGEIDKIPFFSRKVLKDAIEKTKENDKCELILALSYGGRQEIVDAAKSIAQEVKAGKINPNKIDEKLFSSYLYKPEIPDPELMIRTSGECRISNFLLWQLSYSEFWITDKMWPEFNEEVLVEALTVFKNRNRRFGGV